VDLLSLKATLPGQAQCRAACTFFLYGTPSRKLIAFSVGRKDNVPEDTLWGAMKKQEHMPHIDDGLEVDEIELEGREDEEYTDPSKLRPVDAKTSARVMASFNADGTVRTHIKARKTDFVRTLIHLDGKNFNFEGREYLAPVYNRSDKRILLKTARQVEKSTFLANNLVVTSSVIPFNKSLYVSPSHTQTRQFSSEKLKPAIEKSPLIWRYLQDSTVSNQVFEKGFTNGSFIFLRSAFRSADRARGISARVLTLDEIQDLLISDIPVIMECTSHFEDSTVYMAGTPKSFDNPIEQYWEESTQNEWLVPCGCGEWNFLDETNILPTEMYTSGKVPPGPVCSKCSKPIDVTKGKWFSLAPTKMITGYRIPQLMVPWIISTLEQWMKLLWKRDNYPYGQFANEVLGLSYDAASKPITRAHIMKACEPYDLWNPNRLDNATVTKARRVQLVGGVDWGEGNDGSEKSPSGKLRHASYTVFTVGYYETYKKFKVVLVKRYMGKEIDPDYVVADICRLVMSLGIKVVGADWGHGWGVNNTLIRKLGVNKVMVYQYLPKLKERIKWDKIGIRWQLQRNLVMSELFYDIKSGYVAFPRWEQFEPYAKDILAIYSEYSDYMREIRYDHKTSDPDDFFHSLLLCKQTADIYLNKSRRYTIPD